MTFAVSYTWGSTASTKGKLLTATYPSGSRVNYFYDAGGRINSLSVNPVNPNGVGTNLSSQLTVLSAVGYDGANAPASWAWSDGTVNQRSYDVYGRLLSFPLGNPSGIGAAGGLLRTLSYDNAGHVLGMTHTQGGIAQPQFDQTFGYDGLDRLTTSTVAGSSYGYNYDLTGNRTTRIVGGTSYTNGVDTASNRLLQVQSPGPSGTVTATYGYDAAGNATNDGAVTYGYSDRGRTSSATVSGGTVTYLYNALEQRVGKAGATSLVPTGAGYFVYDEAGRLLGEYDSSGAPVYETIYLSNTPVAVMKQTGSAAAGTLQVNLYNVYADHLDTPRVITRSSDQAIVWHWDGAEPFGATPPDQNPNGLGTFVFNQRFPGQVFDAETGNFQNINRDYAADLGRYKQSDPIGLKAGVNTYAYALASPLVAVDPSGLQVEWSGQVNTFGATAGLGGQLLFFSLQSECKCNRKVSIRGFASFVTIGAGLSLKGVGKALEDAAGTNGSVDMTDQWSDCPDGSAANGSAWQSGFNVVVGVGGSIFPALKLGRLRTYGGLEGPAFGFDVSATSTVWGQSAVTSVNVEKCCDGKSEKP